MFADRYHLLAQLGVGPDGVSYRADDSGEPVEIRVLSVNSVVVVKRLRLAALLRHPVALAVRDLHFDADPAYVVLETTPEQTFADKPPQALGEVLRWAEPLAAALAEAHHVGLIHGRLRPGAIRLTPDGQPKMDFTGLDLSPDDSATRLTVTELDDACRAPELADGLGDAAADVYALGATLGWLLTGQPARSPGPGENGAAGQPLSDFLQIGTDAAIAFEQLLRHMTAADPDKRPTAAQGADFLRQLANPGGCATQMFDSPAPIVGGLTAPERPPPRMLGRFRLLDVLGKGGMGIVYRAEDTADGSIVAVKVPRPELLENPAVLLRFRREARLWAQVQNPYVVRLLEVNEDQGTHYLVMEYLQGQSLAQLLAQRGRLDETAALTILADTARGLIDAHERGIVHRDVKPENILLTRPFPAGTEKDANTDPTVKLLDFGLAREVEQSESLRVTVGDTRVGTPVYMAPEQCDGRHPITSATDVYALGVNLYHMLAGRPPFEGTSLIALIAQQCNDAPPPLQKLNPDASDGVCRVVEKALSKLPEARYADAAELVQDLDRLRRGEPTGIAVHPRLPAADSRRVCEYDWSWELEASPAALWPHVSNTERLNRAIGLSAVSFSNEAAGPGVRRFGTIQRAGFTFHWEEHPFEWVEGRRMGVLREFDRGLFKWLVSIVELTPRVGGGTTLTHRLRVEPAGWLGRVVAAVEIGYKTPRALGAVYRRIDALASGKAGPTADAFEEPQHLAGPQRRRLTHLLAKLIEHGVAAPVTDGLGDFLATGSAQDVARIRPLALARRLGLDPEQVVAACLYGAREGLFVLMWDILCPICRIPTQVIDTLRALREHGKCEACNLNFDLDFANSVEMIFRAHPEVRESELGTYCIGGPAHSPHVAAQVRVAPGERFVLELGLPEGAYRLRGPQLPFAIEFRVQAGAPARRWEIRLQSGPQPGLPQTLGTAGQLLALTNDYDQEMVVRIERTAARADALTAARASALALFRELFPGEVLSSGQLFSVATVTLLVTELDEGQSLYERLGDARAFALVHEHFRLLDEIVRRAGGALVKTVDAGILAAFNDTASAVAVACELPGRLAKHEATGSLGLRVGVHRGPALVATLNDHLDYFGATVNLAARLPRLAGRGQVVLSDAVTADPQVAAWLRQRRYPDELVADEVSERVVHRLTVRA